MAANAEVGECAKGSGICAALYARWPGRFRIPKDKYPSALFYRLAGRHGVKEANLAVACQVLRIMFHIIRDGGVYREVGGDYFDRLHRSALNTSL